MTDANGFAMDARLTDTSFAVADWPLCHVRLSDDSRWPWLLLIPRRDGVKELFELSADDRQQLVEEAAQAARIVNDLIDADKTNVATLGNQVPQMHVHVIGRLKGDPAWPGPIWGIGEPVPYSDDAREAMIASIRTQSEL